MTVTSAHAGLSAEQSRLLQLWLPDARIEHDHGWDVGLRSVLEVSHLGQRFIVKAGTTGDHHMEREITAHEKWLAPWVSRGRAPVLVHADRGARLLVTEFLPGHLVLDSPAQDDPDVFRQAGELLRLLHRQASLTDADAETRENARSLAWLDSQHRITPQVEAQLRAEIQSWPTPSAVLVPTHGDWQPRNWLIRAGRVAMIDFGRAGLRPAMTDLSRLAAQDFARDGQLEKAFFEGYGADPREPAAWRRTRVREAIGTAVWAHQVGDEQFEAQGHRMISAALTPAAL